MYLPFLHWHALVVISITRHHISIILLLFVIVVVIVFNNTIIIIALCIYNYNLHIIITILSVKIHAYWAIVWSLILESTLNMRKKHYINIIGLLFYLLLLSLLLLLLYRYKKPIRVRLVCLLLVYFHTNKLVLCLLSYWGSVDNFLFNKLYLDNSIFHWCLLLWSRPRSVLYSTEIIKWHSR